MENIIAQNEHVTLRELRTQISATSEGKLPTFKQLMEMKSAVVAQKVVNTALLTVYQNGYAVYEADGARTVMAVDRCKEYTYDFDNGTRITIQQELLENEEWSIRLYFYKGMSQQAIAQKLGIGRRAVGNCIEGALEKIKKIFQKSTSQAA